MQKHTLLAFAFFVLELLQVKCVYAQTICLKDSTHTFNYYTPTHSWQQIATEYFTYDADNNVAVHRYAESNTNTFQHLYAYDANHNITSHIQQQWIDNAWLNHWEYAYTYNGLNDTLTETIFTWDTLAHSWNNYYRTSYNYANQNKIKDKLEQSWDTAWLNVKLHQHFYNAAGDDTLYTVSISPDGVNWINSARNIFTYDSHHNKLTDTLQSFSQSIWTNSTLNTYTYDGNNNELSQLNQLWSDTVWEDGYRSFYTYDGNNNQTTSFSENWYLGSWTNQAQYTTAYNNQNKPLSYLYQFRTYSTDPWDTLSLTLFSYDNYNNLIYTLNKNGASNGLVDADSIYNYYQCGINAVSAISNKEHQFSLYPNPASSGNVTLTMDESLIGSILTLTDITGREINSVLLSTASLPTGQAGRELSTATFANGIYFVTIRKDGAVFSQKLVVQR